MPSGIYKRSEEHKVNISKALTGRKLSHVHSYRMGLTKIGNTNFLGKHHTVSSKLKLKIAHSGKILKEEHKRKIGLSQIGRVGAMLGKKHTLETRKKMSCSHKGEKHHFWRGGITTLRRAIRNSFQYKEWRKEGFIRDNFACVIGGAAHGNKLHFDHIKKFSDIMIENKITTIEEALSCPDFWNLENGRTLCESCHFKTDTWGRRKNIYGKN